MRNLSLVGVEVLELRLGLTSQAFLDPSAARLTDIEERGVLQMRAASIGNRGATVHGKAPHAPRQSERL